MEAPPPSYNDVMTGQWQQNHHNAPSSTHHQQQEASYHHAPTATASAPLMTDDEGYSTQTSKQLEASTSFMTPPQYTAPSAPSPSNQVTRDDGSTVSTGVSSSGIRLISVTPTDADNISNNQPERAQELRVESSSDDDDKFSKYLVYEYV